MTAFTRKQVADASGVTIEAVRFYEKETLIAEPPRTQAGYRQYPVDTVQRIRFIKRAQSLGFSLPEIRELLTLRMDPDTTAAEIRQRAEQKIRQIEAKIQALHAMKEALETITDACSGQGSVNQCPILASLETDPAFATLKGERP